MTVSIWKVLTYHSNVRNCLKKEKFQSYRVCVWGCIERTITLKFTLWQDQGFFQNVGYASSAGG